MIQKEFKNMDFWNLFEHPTFMFIFHEIVCILGMLYYLPAMLTRIREKKKARSTPFVGKI